MKILIGIVGLPNVGKSTLFNALLKKQVADASNYPFCTIEPNVGVVEVPDERLPVIAKLVKTERIVPAVVEFYDIAGLVKGAAEGEGLGNKFLSHIREVAAIAHVVRLFDDENVIHVANKVDPLSDIKTIDAELILADLATLDKQPEPRMNASKDDLFAWEVIKKLKKEMNKGISARNVPLEDEEKEAVRQLNLLTIKPQIFVFNVSESQLENKEETEKRVKELIGGNNYVLLNAKLENDVLAFPEEEQKAYLKQFNLEDTGLNRLIKKSYEILGLISFLTGGTLEARAWTIKKGTLAPTAAGVIHTDFEKKFIKADIAPYPEFVASKGWVGAREKGKVQIVGKDYEMNDGDVVEFKIGA
jgi:hypothetical protein